jgi:hypothetical protein
LTRAIHLPANSYYTFRKVFKPISDEQKKLISVLLDDMKVKDWKIPRILKRLPVEPLLGIAWDILPMAPTAPIY